MSQISEKAKTRVCIVTPSRIGPSETFIKAHVDLLPHDILAIHGGEHGYSTEKGHISDWYRACVDRKTVRWINLLPRFIEFRLRQRYFPPASDIEIVQSFLVNQKVDVVLAEYGTAAALIMPACRLAGVPLVAHFHGFDASRYKVLEAFGDLYREMFKYASSVISVSRAMTRDLEKLGCREDIIRYNPYGPDKAFFEIEPDYESNTLVSVGRFTDKKAPYLTMEAFRRVRESCPDLKLCFIGDGQLLEMTENLARAWGIESSVEFVGTVEPGEVRRRLEQSFVFIQHSVRARDGDSEGTPVAILEAGAAGLPVVATKHAGIPDVVIDGETGFLVEEHDVEAMRERIMRLVADRELAQKMGALARKHIAENFSMEKHIENLDQILICAVRKHAAKK